MHFSLILREFSALMALFATLYLWTVVGAAMLA